MSKPATGGAAGPLLAKTPPDAPPAPPTGGQAHDPRIAALASHTRYQILDALTPGPKTIRELSAALHLHRVTLRYHLGFLLAEGLVEELAEEHRGRAGRPAMRYRVARHARIPGFPPRRFEFIAQAALASLLEALGAGDASRLLHAKGKAMGGGVVHGIAATKNVKKWSPAAFDEHILKGSYREMGVSTEVLNKTANSIEYRAHGCPFLELAEQMPDVVCDALDRGFHDGMDEALGSARTVRRRCMGHGDLYCEYAVTWAPPRPARPARPAAPKPKAKAKEVAP